MTTGPGSRRADPPLAQAWNAACHCIRLDRAKWHGLLAQATGAPSPSSAMPAGVAAGTVVFVDDDAARAMDRTARLAERALASAPLRRLIAGQAPAIARAARGPAGVVLGVDFHLGGALPQLIEINTNPGGLLVNLGLAQALAADCEGLAGPVERLATAGVPLAALPGEVVASFESAWGAVRGAAPLRSVAIVDDDPPAQHLHAEFLMYRRLLERAGLAAPIVDAAALELRAGTLWADAVPVDLVYNRVTDFYLVEQRHSALRVAVESGAAVVAPDPAAHAHWADKRLLAWLRDESLLAEAGLDAAERAHLLATIPPTQLVRREDADALWRRRKELFFKPVDGYGSKAAYRGDKLTRSAFAHVLEHRYVAQALVPTSTRRVVVDGQTTELRADVRNYRHAGTTWLRAARLYRGQTTNFRTPGGGFAPVLTLPG